MLLIAALITMEFPRNCHELHGISFRCPFWRRGWTPIHPAGRVVGSVCLSKYWEAYHLPTQEQMVVVLHTRKLSHALRSENMLVYLDRNPAWIDNKQNTTFVWIL